MHNSRYEHQTLPRKLALERHLVLHAAFVRLGSKAAALTGPSGAGKSTLSAFLRQCGWTLFGDDTISVTTQGGEPKAQALFPRLRLNIDSLEFIGGGNAKERGIDGFGKHVFELTEANFSETLNAIFILDASQIGEVSITRLKPADACLGVVANSFAHDANNLQEASVRMGFAADLASHIPVFRLCYPRDFVALPRVAAAITETLAGIETQCRS